MPPVAPARRAVRGLRARAVLRGAVRLLRLQHLHRDRARRRWVAGGVRRPRGRRGRGAPAARSGPDRPPVETVFFGGGTPTLLPAARPGARSSAAIDDRRSGSRRAPRSPPRPTPTASRRRAWPRCARAASPGSPSGCSRPCRTCCRCSSAPTTRPGSPQAVRLGAGGRLRAGEPRPDLRDAGGVPRRLGGLDRRRPGVRAGPRLGVLPDRGGRHPPRPPGAHRRDPGARRRRPRRQVRPGRRRLRGGRAGAGTRCPTGRATRPRAAGTTSSTGPARAGGASARARTRTWRGSAGGTSSTPARTPPGSPPASRPAQDGEVLDERDPRDGAGAPGGPPPRRPAARLAGRPRWSTTSSPAGSPTSTGTGSCSPAGVGCWGTRWCASWWGEGAGFPGRPGKPVAGRRCFARPPPGLPTSLADSLRPSTRC